MCCAGLPRSGLFRVVGCGLVLSLVHLCRGTTSKFHLS